MTSYQIFIVAITFGFNYRIHASSNCVSRGCSGPYRISEPKTPSINLTHQTLKMNVHVYTGEISYLFGYRTQWIAQYFNPPIGSCYKEKEDVRHFAPSQGELEDWIKNGKCTYGIDCTYGKDSCWSDDAILNYGNKDLKMNSAVHKEFSHKGKWNCQLAHTAIESDWRCGFTRITQEPKAICNAVTGLKFVFENGTEMPLELKSTTMLIDSDTRINIDLDKIGNDQFAVDSNCYSDPGDNHKTTYCQLPSDSRLGEHSGTVVSFGEGIHCASSKNALFHLECKHDNTSATCKDASPQHSNIRIKESLAPDVHSLMAVSRSLVFGHEQTNYNLFLLQQMIATNQRTLKVLLESVGKIDDELIPSLMGGQGKTKWFNPYLFDICPCYEMKFDLRSNCKNGFTFLDGRYTRVLNSSGCSTYAEENIRQVDPFYEATLDFASLQEPPLANAANDWEGWSWFAKEKSNMINSVIFSTTAQGSNNGISYIMRWGANQISLYAWWTFITSNAGVIALLLSVVNCIRR